MAVAMRRGSRRSVGASNTAVLMAGWLFADLMLVLFVVGLGTQPTSYLEPAPTAQAAEPVPSPLPQPEAPPTLAKEPISVDLSVDFAALRTAGASRDAAVVMMRDQVLAVLQQHGLAEERAGMVLIFSTHENPGEGVARSEIIAESLRGASANHFGDTTMRAFWRGGEGASSAVRLEIYVIR